MKEEDVAGKTGRKTSDADINKGEEGNAEGEENKGDDQASAILPLAPTPEEPPKS